MDKREYSVIVVDDEKLITRNIAAKIEKANPAFKVVQLAYDGEQAFELIKKYLPDVVFSDIKMPIWDGLELLRNIRVRFPSIKVVMVSGYNDFELVRNSLQQDAFDYMLKPIRQEDLEKTLQKLETRLRAERQDYALPKGATSAEIVEQVLEYLRENYAQDVEFAQIADSYHISSAYLCKIFKDCVGMTPSRYRNVHRINVARDLLMKTDLPIKTIAEKAGFTDQFYFSKIFKKITGQSPAQFREEWAGNAHGLEAGGSPVDAPAYGQSAQEPGANDLEYFHRDFLKTP